MLSFCYEGYIGVQQQKNDFCEAHQQRVITVEEIASLADSRVFRRCPSHGLGWSSGHTSQVDFAEEDSAQLEEKKGSINFVIVKRTEQEDQHLQLEEFIHEVERIDMLILCEEETKGRLPYLSPPKKLTHRRIAPVPCSLEIANTMKEVIAPAAATGGANKRKRAPRKCQRCLQFGGEHHATTCNGSKGRYGQKGCEYFTFGGNKKTPPNIQ
jgi:hypothetical protein